jgi:ribokinase
MTVRLERLPAPGETRLGGEFLTSPGGKGANQAVAAARAGAAVTFLTAVGDDAMGREALERCGGEGIDVRWARVIAGVASGVALIFVGEAGENMIGVAPGANACLTAEAIDALPRELFTPKGVFLASLEVPLETVVRGLERARTAGMTTVLNPAPLAPKIADPAILGLVDVLTPNLEEARELAPRPGPRDDLKDAAAAAARIRAAGVGSVAVTLGARGCLVATNEGSLVIPAPEVIAVDTVGAGDAFNGALAAALAEGRSLAEAAAWACAAGAMAVTRPGAQGASPRRDEIDRLAAAVPPPILLLHEPGCTPT